MEVLLGQVGKEFEISRRRILFAVVQSLRGLMMLEETEEAWSELIALIIAAW
jgi:citrate lyase beta subunit